MTRILLDIKATCPMLGDLLNERYQILQVLSSGAFGRTYIAEDTSLPGSPKCIIRHLKPASNDPKLLPFVKHLCLNETKTLERLGQHEQIPKLLAFFEDDQGFYLVQEFIQGQLVCNLVPINQRIGKPWTEDQVIELLQEVLTMLEFFHSQGIVHCDIKPNNLIKRASDGKICLIDFGAVQPVPTTQTNDTDRVSVKFKFQPAGYIPAEQLAYQPRANSDIYALGMIAIQALTAIHPTQLELDSNTSEINWRQQVQVSDKLASVINQMVRHRHQDRYQTATEVLLALNNLVPLRNVAVQNPEFIQLPRWGSNLFQEAHNDRAIAPTVQNLEAVLDLTDPSINQVGNSSTEQNIIPSAVTNILQTTSKSRNKIPTMALFGVGMVVNTSLMIAGFFYITQPDPSQFKEVDHVLNQLPWEEMSKAVCEIPLICFWQKK